MYLHIANARLPWRWYTHNVVLHNTAHVKQVQYTKLKLQRIEEVLGSRAVSLDKDDISFFQSGNF